MAYCKKNKKRFRFNMKLDLKWGSKSGIRSQCLNFFKRSEQAKEEFAIPVNFTGELKAH